MFLAAAALASAITIEDYASMPSPSSPQFSPDGKRIAYVLTRPDLARSVQNSDIWMVGIDGTGDRQLSFGPGGDDHPRWSPDGASIAFLSDRDGRSSIWIIDLRGGEASKVTSAPGPIRDFEWSPSGEAIAYVMTDPVSAEEETRSRNREDVHVVGSPRRQSHLFVIEMKSREVRRLTRGDFSVDNIAWRPDGRELVMERLPGMGLDDLYRTDLYTIDPAARCDESTCPRMTPLVVRPGVDRAPQYAPDGRSVAFLSTAGVFEWVGEHQLWVIDLDTHKARLVSGQYDRTPEKIGWLDQSKLFFDGPFNSNAGLFRVGREGTGFAPISRFEGVITDSAVDARRGQLAFVRQSLSEPPELYVSEASSFVPRQLTDHGDAFRNRAIGQTRVVRWKNPQDGLEIEGLLTLPVGYRSGQRVPLLTMIHGGPASRFDQGFLGYLGFLYAPQVLASKGFAVLRPNPRGTGGYGEKFRQANRGDWAGMDWIDINAGIDKVIADGIADSSRLGLMGWSYGGFISSWALGHSDRFRAIAIGAPVVDLLSFHGTTDIRDFIPGYFPGSAVPANASSAQAVNSTDEKQLRRGLPDIDALRARSPLWHLKPTRTHVLIEQGEADERVPLSQGTMLYRLLDELGVEVSMVTYPRSGHVPREPKQRRDIMRRNVEFFEKWMSSE